MRQLISSLADSGAAIDSFVASLPDPSVLAKPVDDGGQASAAESGSWTGADVLAHLLQGELVYAVRIGQVLTRDDPPIAAYDQDAWVTRFASVDGAVDATSVSSWVELHRRLRRRLVARLSTLSADDWSRGGTHEERGVETVAGIVEHLVHHDSEHLAQLRAAVGLDPIA